jgi:hypothetical protein
MLPFEFEIKFELNQHYRLIKDFDKMKTNSSRIVSFILLKNENYLLLLTCLLK